MELHEIKRNIASEDPQDRMKAITALKDHAPEVAVPLLLTRKDDREFMIRSFVAMGLGFKQTPEAYAALLEIVQFDRDVNVRSEAANSLGKYGDVATPVLLKAFRENDHWLMRLSVFPILEALAEAGKLSKAELYDLCMLGLQDKDVMVKASAIAQLQHFAGTSYEAGALNALTQCAQAKRWYVRRQTAMSLKAFDTEAAQDLLAMLQRDEDHRVVAATLESLVS